MDPRQELREAMEEFAPELRFLDCGWVLEAADSADELSEDPFDPENDITVDWVAVDASGRLNLLLWLGDGGSERTAALALEILHRAQDQSTFILSHLGNCGIHSDLAPRLILAADHFSAATLRQLAVLGEERMRLVEVHEVRTEGGVSHHLVSKWPEHLESQAVGPVVFLENLPEHLRAIGECILQCLDHVDDRVIFGGMGLQFLEWRLRDRALCALEHRDGVLLASVAGEESRDLSQEGAADAFIERVLENYFEILEDAPVGDGDGDASLVDQGLSVVLSSEELDAFM